MVGKIQAQLGIREAEQRTGEVLESTLGQLMRVIFRTRAFLQSTSGEEVGESPS
jgi:hypothetical protein